jgi:quinol monooxygenase YgiN
MTQETTHRQRRLEMVTHMHVAFRVGDYESWKAGYDESVELRKASGETSYRIFRSVEDPNVVTVMSEQRSAEEVQAFLDSPDLKDRMSAAGIVEMGRMLLLEEVDSGVH